MTTEKNLMQRANNSCELCNSETSLSVYGVPPESDNSPEKSVLLCNTCVSQVDAKAELEAAHWRCLNDSMWSQEPAVQVMAYRMLHKLSGEPWAQDLLEMLYLEEEVKQWAEADLGDSAEDADSAATLDSNGAVLEGGDTVTLIKDLVVKGANFTAKRGTAVRNISLTSNPEHIEGRVNGTRIVLLTCFLKKS
jgi:protein PhnA